MKERKELRSRSGAISRKAIISLMIGLSLVMFILSITLTEVQNNSKSSGKQMERPVSKTTVEDSKTQAQSFDSTLIGIVKGINTKDKEVTLFDTKEMKEVTLSYYGGTDIRDRFKEIITIPQVPIGTIVEAGYSRKDNKLMKLYITDKAWEYAGVSNFSINSTSKSMKIAANKYRFTEDILVIDGNDFIPIERVARQDELTVRGIDEVIWSITVTKGHGTVRLTDQEAFLGGYVTVGNESMQKVTEDTVITVREGNYHLTVENGSYSATLNVTIVRNEETIVSLKDLGPEAVKYGQVTFKIEPFGADLYIDGELRSYGEPIVLAYGEHRIEVSLGGYTTYRGVLHVDEERETVKVDLPESSPRDGNKSDSNEDGSEETIIQIGGSTSENSSSANTEDFDDGRQIDRDHNIYIQKPEGASVYLNGEFKGISPCVIPKEIGKHVLTLIRDGYETISYSIEVSDDGLDSYYSLPDLVKE